MFDLKLVEHFFRHGGTLDGFLAGAFDGRPHSFVKLWKSAPDVARMSALVRLCERLYIALAGGEGREAVQEALSAANRTIADLASLDDRAEDVFAKRFVSELTERIGAEKARELLGDSPEIRARQVFEHLADSVLSREDAPSEDAPSETAPSEDEPSEDAPSEDAPSEDAPSEDAPSEDAPSEDAPSEDAPSEDAPSEDAPSKTAPKPRKRGKKRRR